MQTLENLHTYFTLRGRPIENLHTYFTQARPPDWPFTIELNDTHTHTRT